ncbi:cyun140 [Cyclophragma undans nucleopolyhedrovirus]|uniref:Cyun140 n=1 Tax=Cyclophragma undans nucleopolyhedrovirus TaxID=1906244 RepID=A0A288Q7M0_9ABAC|nr:cyun140 [Cyclophragma undans nucleopolyhedrovirus]AOT85598.1 cyun140 [Cyclophragma undans nucleopolyhedrovirus]
MSLASKLIVYNHFATFFSGTADPVYREHYQLYRIINEYLTQSYVNANSCVEREVAVARQLLLDECTFDDALKIIDAGNSVASLSRWYKEGGNKNCAVGIDSCVFEVLKEIDALVSVDRRSAAGWKIFSINQFFPTTIDIADRLKPTLDRFVRLIRDRSDLMNIADALNPSRPFSGWWYNKFCVITYIQKIATGTISGGLAERLSAVVKKHLQLQDNTCDDSVIVRSNCPDNIAQIYGRFCGIGKEHFSHHKLSCLHILFQYLRNAITHKEQEHCCFRIIKDFGRHCQEIYNTPLKTLIDTIYIHSHTDKNKNALFDVLCATSGEELDIDCFYYVVENFINDNNK